MLPSDVRSRGQARGGSNDDGIDHLLWMYHRDAGGEVYFEVDTLGNVRRLVTPDGDSVGGYDYTAFGRTVEPTDDVLPTDFAQPRRWQGRPFFENGGEGIYDFRARWWSPELGAFTTADEFKYLTTEGTLWSWPGQNPFRFRDPSGRCAEEGDSINGGFEQWILVDGEEFIENSLAVSAAALTVAGGAAVFAKLGYGVVGGTTSHWVGLMKNGRQLWHLGKHPLPMRDLTRAFGRKLAGEL